MNRFKTVLIAMLVGGLLGNWVAAFAGQRLSVWYNQPGSGTNALCNCRELAENVTGMLLKWQFWGLLAGAVVGLLAAVLFWTTRRGKAPAPSP